MDAADVYRFRAEEFERNFMSLRDVEWRIALEVFTGYAALAIAYFHLRGGYPKSIELGVGVILLTGLLLAVHLNQGLRLLERLHYTRDMQNANIQKLHELCSAPEVAVPKGVKQPKRKRWYALVGQATLSVSAGIALVMYFAATTPW